MLRTSTALRRVGAGAAVVTIAGLLPIFASTAAIASSVGTPTLTLNPLTGNATSVATVGFTATSAISGSQGTGGDTITIKPNGELLSTSTVNYQVNGQPVMGVAPGTGTAAGSTVITLGTGTVVAAGGSVSVVIGGNTNPATGQVYFGVQTDKDTTPLNTNQVTISGSSTALATVSQVSPVEVPTSTAPTGGAAQNGTPIQITGANFATGTTTTNTVKFVPTSGSTSGTDTITGVTTSVSTQLVVTPNLPTNGSTYDIEVSNDGTNFSPVGTVDEVGAHDALTFIPMVPVRALDTRVGFGGPRSQVTPGTSINVNAAAVLPGAPTNVAAIAVNLTAIGAKGAGYATISQVANTPSVANTSTVNFDPTTDATGNFDIVTGNGTQVNITNATGGSAADFTLDVTGYYTSAQFSPAASRVVDTRPGTGNAGPSAGPLGSRTNARVVLTPPTGATAVLLNATAIHPISPGNLRIFPETGTNASTTSPTNTAAVQYVPNADAGSAIVVPLTSTDSPAGSSYIDLYNDSPSSTNVAVDVVGYLGAGTGATGPTNVGPNRAIDTRTTGPVTPGAPTKVNIASVAATNGGSVSATTIAAALVSVVSIQPTSGGNLAAYPDGAAAPNGPTAVSASTTVNYYANNTRENFTIVGVRNGILDLAAAGVPTNATVDVVGVY